MTDIPVDPGAANGDATDSTVPMLDLSMLQRIECCILMSAEAILKHHGLPIPARVASTYWGEQGSPLCCDALLVTMGDSRPNIPPGDNRRCGVYDKIVRWDVRIFRDVCQFEPECGNAANDRAACFDSLICPGDPWPANTATAGSCEAEDRAVQSALLKADRHVLEAMLASQVKCCLGEASLFACPDEIPCGFICQDAEWVGSRRVSGGGCAGSVITIETRTIGN